MCRGSCFTTLGEHSGENLYIVSVYYAKWKAERHISFNAEDGQEFYSSENAVPSCSVWGTSYIPKAYCSEGSLVRKYLLSAL